MIEPPQADPQEAAQEQQPEGPPAPSLPPDPIQTARDTILDAISAVARVAQVANTPEEYKEAMQGVQAGCQGLLAISPALNPKVFEAMYLPKPQDTGQGGSQAKRSRPGSKAT